VHDDAVSRIVQAAGNGVANTVRGTGDEGYFFGHEQVSESNQAMLGK
jgi:hypothetical protein